MVDLIILDMYGTIVGRGNNATPRNGFEEFMDRYQDKKIVLATDDDLRNIVDRNLTHLGIIDKLDGVYTDQDMIEITGYPGKRKDLKQVCENFGVVPASAVFISDGDKDLKDAQRDGVRFIHLPYYEQGDEPFSFAMINLSNKLPLYLDLRDVNPPSRW